VPTDDAPHDFVDTLMASWAQSRPDFDVTPVAVITRLGRVRDHLEGEMAALFGSFGLTQPTFVMLVTLTRLQGAGEAVTEARIAAELGLTIGTISMRVDRLVGEGLMTRGADGALDLTLRGRDLVEQVVPAHLDNQARLLGALTGEEQAALADLLRRLLASFE
jgi:DNA-binding MarR family transcriptional regulator